MPTSVMTTPAPSPHRVDVRLRRQVGPLITAETSLSVERIRDLIVPIKGYDELKRKLLTGELERYRASISWIKPRDGGGILDIGSCGDLVPVYRRILGFDRLFSLDAACDPGPHRLIHTDGSAFDFEAVAINIERDPYPLPDSMFDQVVAMEVLEHLAVDPMFMLAEANRVLKAGGKLLLTTPNAASLSSFYRMLWSQHPSSGRQAFGPGIMDRHHREYVPRDVIELLESAGFEVVRLDTFSPTPTTPPVLRAGRLLKLLHWLRPKIDLAYRGEVIRCACVKIGPVRERFPEHLYPRYAYYDYASYDRQLAKRFDGRRYWRTTVRTERNDA